MKKKKKVNSSDIIADKYGFTVVNSRDIRHKYFGGEDFTLENFLKKSFGVFPVGGKRVLPLKGNYGLVGVESLMNRLNKFPNRFKGLRECYFALPRKFLCDSDGRLYGVYLCWHSNYWKFEFDLLSDDWCLSAEVECGKYKPLNIEGTSTLIFKP